MVTKTTIIEDGEVLTHVVYANGIEEYFDQNDERHRPNNKPAFIGYDSYTSHWVHGNLNRTDGPAIFDPDGYAFYFLDGVRYTEKDYWKEIERRTGR